MEKAGTARYIRNLTIHSNMIYNTLAKLSDIRWLLRRPSLPEI